jgi:hypothetical protein
MGCPLRCRLSYHTCRPDNTCGSPGSLPSNSVCMTAESRECYDVWGMLSWTTQSGISEQGCGESRDEARTRAIILLSQSVSLTTQDNPQEGYCLWEVTES